MKSRTPTPSVMITNVHSTSITVIACYEAHCQSSIGHRHHLCWNLSYAESRTRYIKRVETWGETNRESYFKDDIPVLNQLLLFKVRFALKCSPTLPSTLFSLITFLFYKYSATCFLYLWSSNFGSTSFLYPFLEKQYEGHPRMESFIDVS